MTGDSARTTADVPRNFPQTMVVGVGHVEDEIWGRHSFTDAKGESENLSPGEIICSATRRAKRTRNYLVILKMAKHGDTRENPMMLNKKSPPMDNLFAPQLDLTVALSVCMFMFKKECLADLCYDTTEGTAYGATPGIFCVCFADCSIFICFLLFEQEQYYF